MTETTVTESTTKYYKSVLLGEALKGIKHPNKVIIKPTTVVSRIETPDNKVIVKDVTDGHRLGIKPNYDAKPKPKPCLAPIAKMMINYYSGSRIKLKANDAVFASGLLLIKKR